MTSPTASSPRDFIPLLIHEVLIKSIHPRKAVQGISSQIPQREIPFVREVLYGVLRNLIYLDWRLSFYLKNPDKLPIYTINNLRSAAYQILFMRVPEWAAVDEAVKSEKLYGRHPGLINAVLRNLLRETTPPELPRKDAEGLSISYSHPRWLVKRWLKRFGKGETESLLITNNKIPPITLRINTLRTDRSGFSAILESHGIPHEFTRYSPQGIRLSSPEDLEKLIEYSGLFYVQDEAAQIVTMLLEPRPGEKLLDACASPGGKASHIAELTKEEADITAVELDEERLSTLRSNLATMGIKSVNPFLGDIMEMDAKDLFDRILLDAPCSSLGVIRRNPDIRYRLSPSELKRRAERELQMLIRVSKFLKPGGRLLYTVCSFEEEEGNMVVEGFLNKTTDFYIIDIAEVEIAHTLGIIDEFRTPEGFFTSLPHRHEMDGFFGALLGRKG